jgi:hypothetical protein
MYAVSQRFLAMLRVPHVVAIAATIEQPDGTLIPIPTVTAGEIDVDASAQVRRTGRVEVPWSADPGDEAMLPVDPRTLAFGSYLRLARGVRYADGTTETAPLGRFRIDAVSWTALAAAASFELADPMVQVTDTLINYVYDAKGKSAQASIKQLIDECFPSGRVYHDSSVAGPNLTDAVYHDSRISAVQALAAGVGVDVYFDVNGEVVIAPVPSDPVAGSEVWTIDAGDAGVLVDTDEGYDRAEAVNGVYLRGIGAWDQAPFEALWIDDTVGSPMRWGGPFGKVAVAYQLESVVDFYGCQAAAAAYFRKRGGLGRTLKITCVPNPALEAGDIVEVVFPEGTSELHRIASMQIPLNPADPMTLSTVSRYGADGGAAPGP